MKSRGALIVLGTAVFSMILVVGLLAALSPQEAEAQRPRPITDEWKVKCYAGAEVIIDTAIYGLPILENGMLVIDTGGRTVRYVCAGNCVVTHKSSRFNQG